MNLVWNNENNLSWNSNLAIQVLVIFPTTVSVIFKSCTKLRFSLAESEYLFTLDLVPAKMLTLKKSDSC